MTYQEREKVVNIISAILITGVFALLVYQKHQAGIYDLTQDFRKWGVLFLIFMGISIVARILILIIFNILNAIATREKDFPVSDERDKFIKWKASRNAYITFSASFAMIFVGLAFGLPAYSIMIAFVICGLIAEIVENTSQIYYYRKGI